MAMSERIVDGFQQARESLIFLKDHPSVLIFWLGVIAVEIIGLYTLPLYEQPYESMHTNAAIAYLIYALTTIAATYFIVSAMHYTMHIIEHDNASIGESLRVSLTKLMLILAWTAVIVIGTFLAGIVAIYFSLPSWLMSLEKIAWILITFYVFPIIATEHFSFLSTIRLALRLLKNSFLEIVSGSCIIFLIFFVVGAPLALASYALMTSYPDSSTLNLSLAILTIIVTFVIQALYAIFKTMMYYDFYRKPMDEVQTWQNPQF